MAKKSNLTIAQRREVVLALIRREEPAAQLARRWSVSEATLYRWRDEFLAGGEAALANGKDGTDARAREIQELQSQVEERDQVIGELTVANRILKKFRASPAEPGDACFGETGVGGQREGAVDTSAPGPGDRDQQLVPQAHA